MQKKGRTTLPAGEAGAAVGEILVARRGLDGADVAGRHAFKGARVTSNLSLSPPPPPRAWNWRRRQREGERCNRERRLKKEDGS
jgi:hypothetical protein